MTAWLYKWLPIFFGCHRRSDRSFFLRGRQFPICARCTGELVGMLAALICCFFFLPAIWVAVLLLLPLIADGGIQRLTSYESTNSRRFVTGLLFGYGFFSLLVLSAIAAFRFGYHLVKA